MSEAPEPSAATGTDPGRQTRGRVRLEPACR